ncbi:MAG: tRNA (adenosine(37)-N6)-dimethylallyltransferase MiaA [Pseudomonadota bacterium]|nr:tRNA (adenosine(37)-N6)-dimethylallyltransferase MiaA [Pseudomonadota bacterium]
MGPTGSGKTDLAIRLTEKLPLEIISVDSALVYRGMDIGTAKPDKNILARTPHHLIDIRDPAAGYSVGEFTGDALRAMEEIWSRGRQPLLVGGTMMYFHALTNGIASLPASDPKVRAEIDASAAALGWAAVHQALAKVDPQAASRIHVNDPQRIQRALEVHRITGDTITKLQQKRMSVITDVNVIEFALAPLERSELHTKIALRFKCMLDAGFVEEVRNLYERGDLSPEHPSMRAVGYRQIWRYLAGLTGLDEATEKSIAATRQLAKRQLTWLRRRTAARWLDSMRPDAARLIVDALFESGFGN